MNDTILKRFLTNTEESGRMIVKSLVTGKTYFVEPIANKKSEVWGDINPATKKIEGSYGEKYKGAINEKESLITKDNGFVNIATLEEGQSPMSEIERRDKEYELTISKK